MGVDDLDARVDQLFRELRERQQVSFQWVQTCREIHGLLDEQEKWLKVLFFTHALATAVLFIVALWAMLA